MPKVNFVPNLTHEMIQPPDGLTPNCYICDQNYRSMHSQGPLSFRYVGTLDDAAAAQCIQEQMATTKEDLSYIGAKLQSHGDLLLTRWTKRSKENRGMTLSSLAEEIFGAWPPGGRSSTLREEHDGCLCGEHLRSRLEQVKKVARQHVRYGHFRYGEWPQIEDFAQDKSKLLTLLHLRTAYPPETWAVFDTEAASITWDLALSPVVFNSGCVQMTAEAYGTLTDFNDGAMHNLSVVGFPRAQLTFESQAALARGLRNLLDGIIDGAEPSGSAKWDIAITGRSLGGTPDVMWGAYKHQAFVPPTGFDMDAIVGRAMARYRSILDEIEVMQTEPDYVRHVAFLWSSGKM